MPRTANARCAGTYCLGAEPQYECEYGDGWCQTHVMGDPGMGGGLAEQPRADFLPTYTVIVPNELMEKAGIVPGDAITHIDNCFPNNMDDFATLVADLPAGTILKVWRDGKHQDVTL